MKRLLKNLSLLVKTNLWMNLFLGCVLSIFVWPLHNVSPMSDFYTVLAPFNQAWLMCLILSLAGLLFVWLPNKGFQYALSLLFGGIIFIMLINTTIYPLYKFHLNGFLLSMFFTDFGGFGFSAFTLAKIAMLLVIAVLIVFLGTQYLSKYLGKKTIIISNIGFLIVLLVGQGLHAYGYAHNMRAYLQITPQLPWYQPLIATKEIKQWGWFNESLQEENLSLDVSTGGNFVYPKQPLQCTQQKPKNVILIVMESVRADVFNPQAMPKVSEFAKNAWVFDEHLSGGNVTTKGLFSLFFGINVQFWDDANASGISPAIMDTFAQYDYQNWILANQDIKRTNLHNLFFKDLPSGFDVRGKKSVAGDIGITDTMVEKINRQPKDEPFFAFMFYNSTHHNYYSDEHSSEVFTPAEHIEMGSINNDVDPVPLYNQYLNSAHFVDGEIDRVLQALKQSGQLEQSIVIITSDHGEEFNDQNENYWGHGSNFSRYQVQVPLIISWPGKSKGVVSHRTSHFDVFPTILEDEFLCDDAIELASNGESLFSDETRFIGVSSYLNNGYIYQNRVDDDKGGFMASYHFDGSSHQTPKRDPNILQLMREQLAKFRK